MDMKPPHPPRHGGSGRPPSDRGPSSHGSGGPSARHPGPAGHGPQRRDQSGSSSADRRGHGSSGPDAPREAQRPGSYRPGGQGHVPGKSHAPGGQRTRDAAPRDGAPRDGAPRERPRPDDAQRPPRRDDRPAQAKPFQDRPKPEQQPRLEIRRPPQQRPEHAGPRPGSADQPRGTVWLYGHHAVAAALANPARRLRRLLLTEEAEASLAQRLPPPWSIAHERVDRARLDQLLGRDMVHQGAALLADPLATPGLTQTLERPGPILVLDQVSDPRNVGAILRSAAAFGACAVITQDRNAPDESGALAKAASGALERVPLLRAVNIARTLIALKAAGCWVIGLDGAAPAPLSGPALAARRVVLVLGAEGEGLRRLTRETCDELAGLAMPGGMESLNVSAAAAISLYELTRRP
jgi:23S rRNA (guanosine2251-2'-O)-methyltransferase